MRLSNTKCMYEKLVADLAGIHILMLQSHLLRHKALTTLFHCELSL